MNVSDVVLNRKEGLDEEVTLHVEVVDGVVDIEAILDEYKESLEGV